MSYQLQFGSFTFPKGFYPAAEDLGAQAPSSKLPRADGAVQLQGYLDRRKVSVRGMIIHDALSLGSFRTQLDAIKAATRQAPSNLQIETDRYYRSAQAVANSVDYEHYYGRMATNIQIDFETPDPFQYSTATATQTATGLTSGASWTVTAGGNAYTLPQFSLTAAATGTITATVSATVTGESFTLAGAVTAGNVIVVDSLAQNVTIGGNSAFGLFNGLFPRLQPATACPVTVSWSGTVSVTAATTVYQNRWY